MTQPALNRRDVIEKAFAALGVRLQGRLAGNAEVLIVGGVAGVVTGVFEAGRVTHDVDVMAYQPPDAWSVVEHAAAEVAAELGMPDRWLNGDCQLRADTLPDGWSDRRALVGRYGLLTVYAASRPDLIAMKVIAGRPQDLEDLLAAKVRSDEAAFVRRHLESLEHKGTPSDQITDALDLLGSLQLDRP